jgi:hypothetical protein
LRGYYEHLALIHEHYSEVDSLLSGELPANIVSSFAGRKRDSANWGDLEYDVQGHGHGHGVDDRPEWERHTSAWKIKKKRASIDHILGEENGNGVANLNDEEQEIGEGTRLLSEDIEQRDARREKIARLALNSERLISWRKSSTDDSQHHRECHTCSSEGSRCYLLRLHIPHRFPCRLCSRSTEYGHHLGNQLGDRCADR